MAALTIGKHVIRICQCRVKFNTSEVRTLLSESYSCKDVWKARYDTPIFKQVQPALFASKIQDKLDREKTASAIDMDILANCMDKLDKVQLDFVQDLFKRFYKTQAARNMSESTSHAYIRALMEFQETERLLEVLKDKLNYGLFLDTYTANMLLDNFIENKQYQEAAEIAADQMLQEDFSHPITRYLSWYASHLYWKHVLPQLEPEIKEEPSAEDEEEDWRVVPFIINPWYDDHFDIPTLKQRVGKTLVMLGKMHNDSLGDNYQLIGWALYHKFNDGLNLLNTVIDSDDKYISQAAVDTFKTVLDDFEPEEPNPDKEPGYLTLKDVTPRVTEDMKTQYQEQLNDCIGKLTSKQKIKEEDLEDQLKTLVHSVVPKYEDYDIKELCKLMEQWNKERQELLDQQIAAYQEKVKKYEIAKKLTELQEREEKLRFFEDRNKIRMAIKKAKKMKEIRVLSDDEQYVAAPGERNK